MTTDLTQKLLLLQRLYAFGYDGQTQRISQADDAVHNGTRVVVGGGVADKRAVNFELVGSQALEVRQRRLARTEVIYADAHTQFAHALNDALTGFSL